MITKVVPGLNEALKSVPSEWSTWINQEPVPLTKEELSRRLADASGVLVVADRIDSTVLEAAPNLKIISNYGVGVDNIDLQAAKGRGVIVTNLPHEVTYSTAELAIALMLACARRIADSDRYVRSHNPFKWTPTVQLGINLQGKTLGLVGFGRIGQSVARMAKAFDMKILYYSRSRKVDAEEALGAEHRSLEALLRESDVVSLHVPATPETVRLINRESLALMKPEAILVNTARGAVVDEAALVEALTEKRIWGAGLDVYEREPEVNRDLVKLDNVVLTPHVGTSTQDARAAMTMSAVHSLTTALQGGEPPNRVV